MPIEPEHMFGQGIRLEDHHKVIPDGDWMRSIKEKLKNPRLFVYHHTIRDKFVICEWQNERERTATELFVVSKPPDHHPFDMPTMDKIQQICRPMMVVYDEMQHDRLEQKKDLQRGLNQDDIERKEAIKLLKKHGMEEAAMFNESYATPYVGAGTAGQENMDWTNEQLNGLASDKVWSSKGAKPAGHKF